MDASKSPFDDPEILGKSESATGDASSATAIFGTVSAKPAPQQDDDLLKSLMGAHSSPSSVAEPPGPTSAEPPQTQPWTPVGPPTPATQVVPSSGPGEFTEIFQALQNPAPASTSTPAAPPAAAYTPSNALPKTPADLANVFTQVVVEKTIFTPPPAAPPPSKASEFTQLLQTLNASTQKPEPEVAAPPQPPAAGTPGTFTQLFNTVSARPTEAPQTSAIPPCVCALFFSYTIFQVGYARRSRGFYPRLSVGSGCGTGSVLARCSINSSSVGFRPGVVHGDVLGETNGEHPERKPSQVVEVRAASAKHFPVLEPRSSAGKYAPGSRWIHAASSGAK